VVTRPSLISGLVHFMQGQNHNQTQAFGNATLINWIFCCFLFGNAKVGLFMQFYQGDFFLGTYIALMMIEWIYQEYCENTFKVLESGYFYQVVECPNTWVQVALVVRR
jgi:hypothetical protein